MPSSPLSSDNSRWYSPLLAAFDRYTTLPFRQMHQPSQADYVRASEYWPLVGWLSGGITAATLWFGSYALPYPIVVLLAVCVRVLLTGGQYETGLSHFADGLALGSKDRGRILEAMTRWSPGPHGVLTLILYNGLLCVTLYLLGPYYAALSIAAADPFAKMLSTQVSMMLPYLPTANAYEAMVAHRPMGAKEGIVLALEGLLPGIGFCWLLWHEVDWQMLILMPCLLMYVLYRLMAARLRGYTDSCSSAFYLLCELTTLLTAVYYLRQEP